MAPKPVSFLFLPLRRLQQPHQVVRRDSLDSQLPPLHGMERNSQTLGEHFSTPVLGSPKLANPGSNLALHRPSSTTHGITAVSAHSVIMIQRPCASVNHDAHKRPI